MQGQIAEHPLAEIIREINQAGLSGAVRLSRENARVVVYFDDGEMVFAVSNLRAHRLREVLKRNGITESELADYPATMADEELAKKLQENGKLAKGNLNSTLSRQASDVLRVALLWTEGTWQFDNRVRIPDEARVRVDTSRLLLECARHLPLAFVKSRFNGKSGSYSFATEQKSINLLPVEASIMTRVANAGNALSIDELNENGGPSDDDLRSVYALSLSGLLEPSSWPSALSVSAPNSSARRSSTPQAQEPSTTKVETADNNVDSLFARLATAKNYYDTLGVARSASEQDIKQAYRGLALRFHPDRFHQASPELRLKIESAFTAITRAYDTLANVHQRAEYDQQAAKPQPVAGVKKPVASGKTESSFQTERAETSFQRGLHALTNKQFDDAVRCLAEAALLAPREARYRANYGYVLMSRPNMRRNAEFELQAAIALDPNNVPYRVMLAELYKQLGLVRRAESELARALAINPKHEAAKTLLASLKRK